jgi:hypothetical protein
LAFAPPANLYVADTSQSLRRVPIDGALRLLLMGGAGRPDGMFLEFDAAGGVPKMRLPACVAIGADEHDCITLGTARRMDVVSERGRSIVRIELTRDAEIMS